MGKTAKNKKRRLAAELTSTTTPLSSNNSEGDEEETSNDTSFLLGLVSASDLAITVRTLNALTKNTELLKFKELKFLKGAVYDFQRVSTFLAGTGKFFLNFFFFSGVITNFCLPLPSCTR